MHYANLSPLARTHLVLLEDHDDGAAFGVARHDYLGVACLHYDLTFKNINHLVPSLDHLLKPYRGPVILINSILNNPESPVGSLLPVPKRIKVLCLRRYRKKLTLVQGHKLLGEIQCDLVVRILILALLQQIRSTRPAITRRSFIARSIRDLSIVSLSRIISTFS